MAGNAGDDQLCASGVAIPRYMDLAGLARLLPVAERLPNVAVVWLMLVISTCRLSNGPL